MRKRIVAFCFLFCLLFSGCGQSDEQQKEGSKHLYFLNSSATGVERHDFELQSEDADGQLTEILDILSTPPEKMDYKAPLHFGVSLLSSRIEGEKVYLDFDGAYYNMPPTTEILVRAALVRSITQIEGIRYVYITVDGAQLHDNLDNPVGLLSAEQFIDNAGTEINAYEKARLKLYFASEDGTSLIAINRTVAYNTNISMEKLVVEQLLAGPGSDVADEAFPTINPASKIISVSVKDSICYVNFDEAFLTQVYNTSSDVTVYSVVNSLVELPNVNKVQIAINGESDILFRESISLKTVFERNLNLLTKSEQ